MYSVGKKHEILKPTKGLTGKGLDCAKTLVLNNE